MALIGSAVQTTGVTPCDWKAIRIRKITGNANIRPCRGSRLR